MKSEVREGETVIRKVQANVTNPLPLFVVLGPDPALTFSIPFSYQHNPCLHLPFLRVGYPLEGTNLESTSRRHCLQGF